MVKNHQFYVVGTYYLFYDLIILCTLLYFFKFLKIQKTELSQFFSSGIYVFPTHSRKGLVRWQPLLGAERQMRNQPTQESTYLHSPHLPCVEAQHSH